MQITGLSSGANGGARVIVTAGPGYEPIDEVRRLTNFSTGELGLRLANELANAGHATICFKGEGSTAALEPDENVDLRRFTSGQSLLDALKAVPNPQQIQAFFHTAALSDYRVARVVDESGKELKQAKIPSRGGRLILELEAAPKVITELRTLFPNALIVGWKYELEGSFRDAVARAEAQIQACRSSACVVNGRAYGDGFGFIENDHELTPLADKSALVHFLTAWLQRRLSGVRE